jgi:hypothetical protein
MLSAGDAMRQAHATAHEYAKAGAESFEALFGTSVSNDRVAAATFIAAFMRTSAADYHTSMFIQKEG